jgi:hypothetical protein
MRLNLLRNLTPTLHPIRHAVAKQLNVTLTNCDRLHSSATQHVGLMTLDRPRSSNCQVAIARRTRERICGRGCRRTNSGPRELRSSCNGSHERVPPLHQLGCMLQSAARSVQPLIECFASRRHQIQRSKCERFFRKQIRMHRNDRECLRKRAGLPKRWESSRMEQRFHSRLVSSRQSLLYNVR